MVVSRYCISMEAEGSGGRVDNKNVLCSPECLRAHLTCLTCVVRLDDIKMLKVYYLITDFSMLQIVRIPYVFV